MTTDDTREALAAVLLTLPQFGDRDPNPPKTHNEAQRRAAARETEAFVAAAVIRARLAAARRDPEPVASADTAWEALRQAFHGPGDKMLIDHFRPAIEAAIRGTEARASLDVERLAPALVLTGAYLDESEIEDWRMDPPHVFAEAIAREYRAILAGADR